MRLTLRNLLFLTLILWSISTASSAKEETQVLARLSNHGYVEQQLTVIFCDGPVYYRSFNENSWHRVEKHQTLLHGDSLRTGNHGYAVLAWSADNLIMVKPKSGMRFTVHPEKLPQLTVQLFKATLMISARDSGLIEIEGHHGNVVVNHGDTSIQSNDNHEIIKAIKGQAACRLNGATEPTIIPESYYLEILPDGSERPLVMFDPQAEYDFFRRFSNWRQRFTELHQHASLEIPFAIDQVKINNQFLSNLPVNEKGYYQLDSGTEEITRLIHLQFKITPYPGPRDKFEFYLGKNLAYAVREGADGYHEVVFPVPSIPDFLCAIHSVDSLGRKVRVFKAGFTVHNQRSRQLIARQFCADMVQAMGKRDHIWLRNHVSRDYQDWLGNNYFDYIKMLEDNLRKYRDLRLSLHPFRFEFRNGQILVHLNYRLTAQTADWNFRYEDRGTDIFTLVFEDGFWRLNSKTSGLFFARLKVAIDLRMGVLSGRVTDERNHSPIADARVTLVGTRFTTLTDSMGEYKLYNVPPGEYDLKFTKNGFGDIIASKISVKAAGEQF